MTTERANRPTGTGLMRMSPAGKRVEPSDRLGNGSPPTAAAQALSSATEVRMNTWIKVELSVETPTDVVGSLGREQLTEVSSGGTRQELVRRPGLLQEEAHRPGLGAPPARKPSSPGCFQESHGVDRPVEDVLEVVRRERSHFRTLEDATASIRRLRRSRRAQPNSWNCTDQLSWKSSLSVLSR